MDGCDASHPHLAQLYVQFEMCDCLCILNIIQRYIHVRSSHPDTLVDGSYASHSHLALLWVQSERRTCLRIEKCAQ